jgi:hypothetical protein
VANAQTAAAADADSTVTTKPVRFGADILYRVADAEAALETALNPWGYGVGAAASATGGAPAGSPAHGGAELGSPHATAPVPPSPRRPIDRRVHAIAEESEEEEEVEEGDGLGGDASGGQDTGTGQRAGGDASAAAAESVAALPPAPPLPALELEMHFTAENRSSLEAAVTLVREVSGDVALVARGLAALQRLDAADALRRAVAALTAQRPITHRSATAGAEAAVAAAAAAGVGPVLLRQAGVAIDTAVAECELAGAAFVCRSIPVASHAYDADIRRLAAAVETAHALARQQAEASAALTGAATTQGDVAAPLVEPAAPGTDEGAAAASDSKGEPEDSAAATAAAAEAGVGAPASSASLQRPAAAVETAAAAEAPPPLAPGAVVPQQPVDEVALAAASALLSRLSSEVRVVDAVAAADAALARARAAALAHREEDASLLPVPELPPPPPEAVPAAAAAGGRPGSSAVKGQAKPAAKPSAAPAGRGGKPAPEPVPEGPPPVEPTAMTDTAGVPLPDTPQLLALRSVSGAVDALKATIAACEAAGADAACVAMAGAAAARLWADYLAGLAEERVRVDVCRAERAKLERKNRKKAPAKK